MIASLGQHPELRTMDTGMAARKERRVKYRTLVDLSRNVLAGPGRCWYLLCVPAGLRDP